MDSQTIGSVTSPGATSSSPSPRTPNTAVAKTDQASTAHQQQQQQAAAEAARAAAEVNVPQRDPRSLQYQVDRATHRVVATIVDDSSKTVVRQIPDAEIIRIAQAIDRMQGFLVEEKA